MRTTLAKRGSSALTLTGLVVREGDGFYSICPELDIASQGKTVASAKAKLREAVTGYLESCFESNLPILRSLPAESDPRMADADNVVSTFRLKADLAVRVHV